MTERDVSNTVSLSANNDSPIQAGAPRIDCLTINDIARLSGVSKRTVTRVLHESSSVTAQTRERIEAVIRHHNYVPESAAQGLAFRHSFLVAMVFDNPNPQYVVTLQQGILDTLVGTGFELLVRPIDHTASSWLDEVRTFVLRQRLFGVILPPPLSEDERLAQVLEGLDCQFVRIASILLDEPGRMVVTHDYYGGFAAARRLAELGHRIIAHISGPPWFRSSHERRRGFADGLAESGLELSPAFTRVGAYTYESGLECARELLSIKPRPTAIFAGNDEMASAVYRAARENGLRIPQDLSVIGYDDAPVAELVWPSLTSVRLPVREMGHAAAEKLFAKRGGRSIQRTTDFKPALVERGSTAEPA